MSLRPDLQPGPILVPVVSFIAMNILAGQSNSTVVTPPRCLNKAPQMPSLPPVSCNYQLLVEAFLGLSCCCILAARCCHRSCSWHGVPIPARRLLPRCTQEQVCVQGLLEGRR